MNYKSASTFIQPPLPQPCISITFKDDMSLPSSVIRRPSPVKSPASSTYSGINGSAKVMAPLDVTDRPYVGDGDTPPGSLYAPHQLTYSMSTSASSASSRQSGLDETGSSDGNFFASLSIIQDVLKEVEIWRETKRGLDDLGDSNGDRGSEISSFYPSHTGSSGFLGEEL